MARLRYIGPTPTEAQDVVPWSYVASVKAADLTTGEIDTQINAALASYANDSYVDAQDALLATEAYVNSGDSGRIALAKKNVVDGTGVPGLGSNGKLLPQFINLPNNQRWPRAFWSPVAVNASDVNATTETALYTCPVTDPGYPYRVVVFGQADLVSTADATYPVVNVRVGSSAGQIVARGRGMAESYLTSTGLNASDEFERVNTSGIGTDWDVTLTEPVDEGFIYIANGHDAAWNEGTGGAGQPGLSNRAIARRSNPLDAETASDDQVARMTFATEMEDPGGGSDVALHNDIYLRMSEDGTSYLRARIRYNFVGFFYRAGGAELGLGSTVVAVNNTEDADNEFEFSVIGRQLVLKMNGTQIHTVTDTTNLTNLGASYRGWGFGMGALGKGKFGGIGAGQVLPAAIKGISVQDASSEYASIAAPIAPYGLHSQSVITGATTLHVRLVSSAAASVRATTNRPKLWVSTIPA